jgi:hypothetical protein
MQMIAKNLITGMRPTTFLFALSKTNCVQAWRFWSQTDPSVHYVFGEFADMDALRQTMSSEGFIPNPIDQNPWAHWRSPMDMMRQG